MDAAETQRRVAEIEEQGYTILRGAIEPELVAPLVERIRAHAREEGIAPRGNPAEGYATRRAYNLLAKGEIFQRMPVHPNVLPLVEALLDPDCLLSGMTAMDIGPGEKPQPIHPDDIVMDIPRPHLPLVCTSIWALTEFTGENGATRIIPGSHKYDHHPDFSQTYESIPAEMQPGDVLVFHGSLWHGGGGNTTEDAWRLGVNVQYCAGWVRQQQNQWLAVPREIARGFDERLLRLCGYSLYKGLMGHIDGQSPAVVLEDERLQQTAYQNPEVAKIAAARHIPGGEGSR